MAKIAGLVCGVGINDADYATCKVMNSGKFGGKRQVLLCPFYVKWCSMLNRCYSEKYKDRRPSYEGCYVCDEWIYFSNFKAWMETQEWEGKVLDKDLLIKDNKIYSAETCCFISASTNSFITDKRAGRGEWPIGVHFKIENQKFLSNCSNPSTRRLEYLGYYDNPEEAHAAWLKRKIELAKKLAKLEKDPRVTEALVRRYENYK